MLTDEQTAAWQEAGFFIEKSVFPKKTMERLNDTVIARVRENPPEAHRGPNGLPVGYPIGKAVAVLESNLKAEGTPKAVDPEDHISKIFNTHREEGLARDIMRSAHVLQRVGALLETDENDTAIIQSQLIFKNPGAWGQPWHQDSYYFNFSRQPQIGVWISTTRARIENGCLFVAPGSHTELVHEHLAPDRPNSNRGYFEIKDYDFSGEEAVLLDPGDVLYFHSYLMHKSVDNVSDDRRMAYVLHYTRQGTKNLNPAASVVVDIQPVTPL